MFEAGELLVVTRIARRRARRAIGLAAAVVDDGAAWFAAVAVVALRVAAVGV
jgi:hypothetical protein